MAGTAATRPRERGCGSAPKRRVRSGGQHQRVWSSAGGRMSGMAQPVCSQRWQRRAADAVRCGGGVTGSWLWRRGCGCCGYGGCGDGGCGDGGRGCGGRRCMVLMVAPMAIKDRFAGNLEEFLVLATSQRGQRLGIGIS
uniref:Putative retrotransposon protein n=1 Tax=Oryza sativa subsp. indica TaxID=39946 RepID=C5NNQ7_ORYSI|nr:putative retrotransposon protein [Oryza sativa Indica Group]